jgi:hypothetical protein
MKKDAFPPWSLDALRNMYAYSQLIGMKPEPGEAQCRLLPSNLRKLEVFATEMKVAWGI